MSLSYPQVFGVALVTYLTVLYWLGLRASRQTRSEEDFVLAGRHLSLPAATMTLVATWFGAESFMVVANEVAWHGIRRAMLDPFGITLCLLFAGCFVAVPLWRMRLMTVGDFFRERYGPRTEWLASFILVLSYFGWIAAQLMALASLFHAIFAIPVHYGVAGSAIIGIGYCLMGGMWSKSWTDTFQMFFVMAGLLVLTLAMLGAVGSNHLLMGLQRVFTSVPEGHWVVAHDAEPSKEWMQAFSALAIGALGNLPMQDLLQRILAARDERTARHSCWFAAGIYLGLGMAPILIGMGATLLLKERLEEESDVVMMMSAQVLSPIGLLLLHFAILSTVLSTFTSAVLSPAAVIARNLILPIRRIFRKQKKDDHFELQSHRMSALLVVAVSIGLCWMGGNAYDLLLSAYAIGLVSLAAPFLIGLWTQRGGPAAANVSMLVGLTIWTLHLAMDWEWFLEPWMKDWFLSSELAAFSGSLLGYGFASLWKGSPPRVP